MSEFDSAKFIEENYHHIDSIDHIVKHVLTSLQEKADVHEYLTSAIALCCAITHQTFNRMLEIVDSEDDSAKTRLRVAVKKYFLGTMYNHLSSHKFEDCDHDH